MSGYIILNYQVLLQFSWRRGSKDLMNQGGKGLFSKDCISAFNILSISAPEVTYSVTLCPAWYIDL